MFYLVHNDRVIVSLMTTTERVRVKQVPCGIAKNGKGIRYKEVQYLQVCKPRVCSVPIRRAFSCIAFLQLEEAQKAAQLLGKNSTIVCLESRDDLEAYLNVLLRSEGKL